MKRAKIGQLVWLQQVEHQQRGHCSETTLTGESQFYISTPLGIEPGSLMKGSKRAVHWTSETWCECSDIAGSPQGSPPPQQPTMSVVKLEGGPAASVKPGQKSSVRSSGIITRSARRLATVWDKARLRQGHNDQSRWGHQCSETTLTGESRFHISTPLWIEPRSFMTGNKRVVHWTSEKWCECSEIAGSPQHFALKQKHLKQNWSPLHVNVHDLTLIFNSLIFDSLVPPKKSLVHYVVKRR